MTMKTLKITFLLTLALLMAVPAFAQTALTSTTTTAALTSTDTSVKLTSATNVSANGFLYIDGEMIQVGGSYSSGLTVPVFRGRSTAATPHLSGATVFVVAPGAQARAAFINYALTGACTRADQLVLPRINILTSVRYDCFGGYWYGFVGQPALYSISLAPGAQPSAASPAAGTAISIVGQAGGAQLATTSNGAAGAAVTLTGGIGGAGGSSSGTGGAGGAHLFVAGAGGGTITGGAGGAATFAAGAGGNGSTAGGTGGALLLYSGAAGSGGTGVSGAVTIKSGGASGTTILSAPAAGGITISSLGTNKPVILTPTGSGTINITGGTDPTKIAAFDAAGITTGTTRAIAIPDSDITISGAVAYGCGTANACSPALKPTMKIVQGTTAALDGASPSVANVTGLTAFTSTSTYSCTANNVGTSAALAAAGVAVNKVSATAVTFTSANGATNLVSYTCIGF
jgi:hypothetical protein